MIEWDGRTEGELNRGTDTRPSPSTADPPPIWCRRLPVPGINADTSPRRQRYDRNDPSRRQSDKLLCAVVITKSARSGLGEILNFVPLRSGRAGDRAAATDLESFIAGLIDLHPNTGRFAGYAAGRRPIAQPCFPPFPFSLASIRGQAGVFAWAAARVPRRPHGKSGPGE